MSEWSSAFDIANRNNYYTDGKNVDPTYQTYANYNPSSAEEKAKDNSTLSFEDMLLLMVTQLQNQTIDNQADTNDMMNQMIQMTVMQALTEMSTQVEELTLANVMSYSASLVGKEVTVGVLDEEGNISEIVGTVTATGTYDGQQVIFMGDKSYTLNSIMAVGRLPEKVENDKEDGDKTDPDDSVQGGENAPGAGGETDADAPVEEAGGAAQTPENPDNNEEGGTEAAGSEIGGVAGI